MVEAVTPGGDVVLRDRDAIAAEATSIDAILMQCGHARIPRRVDLPSGRVIPNPGGVGCLAYGDDAPFPHAVQTGMGAACYAAVEKTPVGWAAAFRHVPYDPRRMIEMAKAADHPNWEIRPATGWIA